MKVIEIIMVVAWQQQYTVYFMHLILLHNYKGAGSHTVHFAAKVVNYIGLG